MLRLTGVLDVTNAESVEAAAEEELGHEDRRVFVIDLTGVRFVSSTGIGVLESIYHMATRQGKTLAIASAEGSVVSELISRVGIGDGLNVIAVPATN
jgi:anti-anti-sigma factor